MRDAASVKIKLLLLEGEINGPKLPLARDNKKKILKGTYSAGKGTVVK